MSDALNGRIAVVTGADQPLGRGLTLALGRAGARVGLLGEAVGLESTVAELESALVRTVGIEVDWSSQETVEDAFETVADALGPVDIVLHAAVPPLAFEPMDLVDVDDARFEAIWERMLRTTIFLLQAAYPQMQGRGGRVLLVSPTVSMSGAARFTPYTAAVEAQRVLLKATARQWGPEGITLNSIAPAPEHVPIGMSSTEVSLAPSALGDAGDPELDLGPIAVFLASDAGHFVTGATIGADGGIWMAP